MTEFAVTTIIAPNYEAYARVLAKSLSRFHPRTKLEVLVLSERPRLNQTAFRVLSPNDLPMELTEFHQMAAMYSVMELATAVKPWLLRLLLNRGFEAVVYLDPDIELFAPIDYIAHLGAEHGIVLTPHLTRPVPRDGLLPSEQGVLVSGTYNLGFIAVGLRGLPFLDWWQERLFTDCIVDVDKGLFVDQRWIDLAVHFFPHYVLRDPGFDLAYWNLHEHVLSRNHSRYTVDGEPLRAFHFSGYEPTAPERLTKHAGTRPRVKLFDNAALKALVDGYRDRLVGEGWGTTRNSPYPYDVSASGLRLDSRVRRWYRSEVIEGERPPDPFDLSSSTAFDAWLNGDLKASLKRGYAEAAALGWRFVPGLMNVLAFIRLHARTTRRRLSANRVKGAGQSHRQVP